MIYLKKATHTAETGQVDVRAAVQKMLDEGYRHEDIAVRYTTSQRNSWGSDIVVTREAQANASAQGLEERMKFTRFASFQGVSSGQHHENCEHQPRQRAPT